MSRRSRWSDLAHVWDYLLADRAGRLERLAGKRATFTRGPRSVTLGVERLEEWAVAGSLLDVTPAVSSLFAGPFAVTGVFPVAGVGRPPAPPTSPAVPPTTPAPPAPLRLAGDGSQIVAVQPQPAERMPVTTDAAESAGTDDLFPWVASPSAAAVSSPLAVESRATSVEDSPPVPSPLAPQVANTPADPLPASADDMFERVGFTAGGAAGSPAPPAERPKFWSEAGVKENGVAFEANVGQAGGGSAFLARGRGYAVHLAADGATFVLGRATGGADHRGATAIDRHAVRLTLVGANPDAAPAAEDEQTGRANYYLGAEAFPDVARYGRVRFAGVYDGVDAVYRRSAEGTLEYDFEVAPGQSTDAVALRVDGADGWAVAADGSLRVQTSVGELTHRAPVAYQDTPGGRVPVAAWFVPRADGTLGFGVGAHDHTRPLVVDPVVEFSAVVGGADEDTGLDVAVDAGGNTLLTGWTVSPDLPEQLGEAPGGTADAYLAKVSPTGTVLFTTYLGGSGADYGMGVTTDPSGNAYLMGVTNSGAALLPEVTVEAVADAAEQGPRAGKFVVRRSHGEGPLTVDYAAPAGTATVVTDYSGLASAGGTITFESGEVEKELVVTPVDDFLVEGTETVVLTLSESPDYTLGAESSDTLNIYDNDFAPPPPPPPPPPPLPPPAVWITADAAAFEQGAQPGWFTIRRSTDTGTVTVWYAPPSGSAAFGADYSGPAAGGGSVTFLPGEAAKQVYVYPVDDALPESTEWVNLALLPAAGYVLAAPASASVPIIDNDTSGPVVTITGDQDAVEDPNRAGWFTVRRTHAAGEVTVGYGTPAGTATHTTDYSGPGATGGTVTLADGELEKRIYVDPVADGWPEGSEAVVLTLQTGAGYTLGAESEATVNILDTVPIDIGTGPPPPPGMMFGPMFGPMSGPLSPGASSTFPVTPGAYRAYQAVGVWDHFVAKIGPTGQLVYSTLLDGTPTAKAKGGGQATSRDGGIGVTAGGEVVVTGTTGNDRFPRRAAAQNAYGGGTTDAVAVRLNADGSAADFSTFVGGAGEDRGHGVAVAEDGTAWVVGRTASTDLSLLNPFQSSNAGGSDGFVVRLSASGSRTFATYDGTSGTDEATGVAALVGGDAAVVGTSGGQAVVRRVLAAGTAGFRTVVGTGDGEAVSADHTGGVWVGGTTSNSAFSVLNAAQPAFGGGGTDGFVARLNAAGTVTTATFAGGTGADGVHGVGTFVDGQAVAAGTTASSDFPTPHTVNVTDAFVLRYSPRPPAPVITAVSTDTGVSALDRITSDTTLTVSGTAVAGATVTLYLNAAVLGTAVASSPAGTWSIALASALPDGVHPLTATATVTEAGTQWTSRLSPPYYVTVDTVAPLVLAEVDSPVNTLRPQVTVWAEDAVGVPSPAAAVLDVDLNDDGDFADAGETGHTAGTLTNGYGQITLATALPGTGDYSVRARVADLAGNEGASPPVEFTATGLPWAVTPVTREYDPWAGATNAHALDLDRSPGTARGGSPALVYDSRAVSVRPVFQASIQSPILTLLSQVPTVRVQLYWDGVADGAPVDYSTGNVAFGLITGVPWVVAAQKATAVAATGRHYWHLEVSFPSSSPAVATQTVGGVYYAVARDQSAYGAGWDFSLAERLVDLPAVAAVTGTGGAPNTPALPAGVLRVPAAGRPEFYESNGVGGYTSPAWDFGTLAGSKAAGWTYTSPDLSQNAYSAAGLLTASASPDGKFVVGVSYTDGNVDGKVEEVNQVTAADGAVSTFAYNPGGTKKLTGVTVATGATSRTTTVSVPTTQLVSITDPGSAGSRAFAYDTGGRMTGETWAGRSLGWTYNATSGLLATASRGIGVQLASTTITSETSRGVGGPTILRRGKAVDPLGHATEWATDTQGRGLVSIDAKGGKQMWDRYPTGLTQHFTDELARKTSYAYDSAGYLTKVTNPDTSTRSYEYNSKFRAVTKATNELSKSAVYTFDTNGYLTQATDADGVVSSSYTDPSTGLVQWVKDANLVQVAGYAYDAFRRPAATTFADATTKGGPNTTTETVTYDAHGNVDTVTGRDFVVTRFENDPLGRPTLTRVGAAPAALTTRAWYDAMGRAYQTQGTDEVQSRVTFDSRGDVLSTVTAAGTPLAAYALFKRDATGAVVGTRDAAGTWAWAERDSLGRVYRSTDGPDQNKGEAALQAFDKASQPTVFTDPRGKTGTSVFDNRGRATQFLDAFGKQSKATIDTAGFVSKVADPLGKGGESFHTDGGRVDFVTSGTGKTTDLHYNTLGQLDETTDPLLRRANATFNFLGDLAGTTQTSSGPSPVTRWTQTNGFDSLGRLSDVATPSASGPAYTVIGYKDPLGRPMDVSDPNWNHTRVEYNAAGDVARSIDAEGEVTTFLYDALRRRVGATDPNGNTTKTVLDAEGRVAFTQDGAGNRTYSRYDTDGRLQYTEAADGGLTERVYDLSDNLVMLIDPANNTTKFEYDANGRLWKTTDPLGKSVVNTYYDNGWPATRTDRNGRLTEYVFDDTGRLLTETWKDAVGAVVNVLAFTYRDDGSVQSAGNAAGGYTFGYDTFGRLQAQTQSYTGVMHTFGYDAADHVVNVTDSTGGAVNSVYDAGGRLRSRSLGGFGVADDLRVEVDYTARNQPLQARRYDAAAGGLVVGATDFGYDAGGRLTDQHHKSGAGAILVAYANTYDAADRISTETRTGIGASARTFTYDQTSQVTTDTLGGANYTYDKNGNRTMAGYVTGPANRIQSDGTWTYTYDFEGNVVGKSKAGESWQYGYDHRNQMTWAEKRDGMGVVLTRVDYTLDVYGNVVKRVEMGAAERRFAWRITDPRPGITKSVHELVLEQDGTNAVTKRWLNGDGANERWAVQTAGGATSWILPDRLGSVRDLTDMTGVVVNTVAYTAFGGVSVMTNPAAVVDSGFVNMWWDPTVGLYIAHWRGYDPATGQWQTEDPIGFSAGDMNLRRYVGNNATNGIDPTGLEDKDNQPWWVRMAQGVSRIGEAVCPAAAVTGALIRRPHNSTNGETVILLGKTAGGIVFPTANLADQTTQKLAEGKPLEAGNGVLSSAVPSLPTSQGVTKGVMTGKWGDAVEEGTVLVGNTGVALATGKVVTAVEATPPTPRAVLPPPNAAQSAYLNKNTPYRTIDIKGSVRGASVATPELIERLQKGPWEQVVMEIDGQPCQVRCREHIPVRWVEDMPSDVRKQWGDNKYNGGWTGSTYEFWKDARKIEVFEERVHAVMQPRMNARRAKQGLPELDYPYTERQPKLLMLRHPKLLGLTDADIAALHEILKGVSER